MTRGSVYLVGAGPGDPGLLTLKGKRCIQDADAIVYDRLVSPRILSLARSDAQFYYVGKASAAHTMKQADIDSLLVKLAKEGHTVVRLKGGDPFVFGRGGEEALALTGAGIEWQVVPGVTSAVSVPAYAGIPVTHRNVAPSFTVVTGHRCTEAEEIDWEPLAKTDSTLIILMGVEHLDSIVEGLVRFGKPMNTPIALIRWGSRAEQRTLTATLGDVVKKVALSRFQSPACIIVGEVVSLEASLSWFEHLPLFGKKILVGAERKCVAMELAEAAEALGAETLTVSLEQFISPRAEQISYAIETLAADVTNLQSVFFTTSVGVDLFFQQWWALGYDARSLSRFRFGAVSGEVERALLTFGIRADVSAHKPLTPQRLETGHAYRTIEDLPSPILIEVPPVELTTDLCVLMDDPRAEVVSLFDLDKEIHFSQVVENWVTHGCDQIWADSPLARALCGHFHDGYALISEHVADVVACIIDDFDHESRRASL